ncbi:G2H3 [Mytilus coruscus]|uniref:G2H3 n=1 Tax=Mytilus coruscus TaxID=42192 RepID=A0A6J8AZG4_MYTCO|nr:G2H3 [Mytilus coruscus]
MQIPQADRNASMNSDQENTGSSAKPQTDITKTVQSQDIVEGDPEDTGTPTITFHPSCLERRERRSRLSLRSSTGNDALACPSTYRSYVQLFETEIVTVDDSDDEGDKTIPMDGDISLPELLIKLQSQVDLEKITKFNINRNLVLDALEDNLYRDVGLFFPYPLYTEDHHQKFLSPVMYNALVGQAGERNIEDIADGDLRGEVQKFQAATEDGRGEHCWILERFLIDLQEDEDGEITLGDVLSFATGADCVPPLGFDPSPSITFLHDSGLFPKANTCSMELKLPVSEDFNTFKKT